VGLRERLQMCSTFLGGCELKRSIYSELGSAVFLRRPRLRAHRIARAGAILPLPVEPERRTMMGHTPHTESGPVSVPRASSMARVAGSERMIASGANSASDRQPPVTGSRVETGCCVTSSCRGLSLRPCASPLRCPSRSTYCA